MNANNFRLITYANIAHNSPLIFIEKRLIYLENGTFHESFTYIIYKIYTHRRTKNPRGDEKQCQAAWKY